MIHNQWYLITKVWFNIDIRLQWSQKNWEQRTFLIILIVCHQYHFSVHWENLPLAEVMCTYEDRVHVPRTMIGSESFSYGKSIMILMNYELIYKSCS